MKKLILTISMFLLVAGTAFAAAPTGSEYSLAISGASSGGPTEQICVLSNNVGSIIVSTDTAFAATTAHINGSKQYGTSSESTKIYSSAFEEGTTDLETPSDSLSTDFNSSPWSAL